jgi:hypothetical protein
MGSLWSLLKKKDDIGYDKTVFSSEDCAFIFEGLKSHPPKLINATQLVADLKAQNGPINSSHDLTPGFEMVWVEFMDRYPDGTDGRHAISIARTGPKETDATDTAHHLSFFLWSQYQDIAFLSGSAGCLINQFGDPIKGSLFTSWPEDDVAKSNNYVFAVAIETLTTMNTRGTRIEPTLDAKSVQVIKPNRAPCSVWHTIHLPRMPSRPLEGAELSGTVLERREHWVRAHRRDYRHGGGMFGRVKALVWVPEFQRGNPELGTVKQSYEVHRRDPGRAGDTERKALPPSKEA